jgi:predicted alpha/beta superfamily hydrolase
MKNSAKAFVVAAACCGLGACASGGGGEKSAVKAAAGTTLENGARVSVGEPLAIGETFTIESLVLRETRRVNVLVPTVYGEKIDGPMPVLYMLDGGIDEDFLHVAGLVQILVSNGGMRPVVLVGIANTQRRRDMTGPTDVEDDRKIAPVVGGSAQFRRFITEELKPAVRSRYKVANESAVVGESLAGLFVLETLLLQPGLFDTYIAVDPSLWWNNGAVVKGAGLVSTAAGKQVFMANSDEPTIAGLTAQFAGVVGKVEGVQSWYMPLEGETHATVYHPAALRAFRTVLPKGEQASK